MSTYAILEIAWRRRGGRPTGPKTQESSDLAPRLASRRMISLASPQTMPAAHVDLVGLCWPLKGRELVALIEGTAAIMAPSGAIQHFCRIGPRPRQRLSLERPK